MSVFNNALLVLGMFAISGLTAEIATSLPLVPDMQKDAPSADQATHSKNTSSKAYTYPIDTLSHEQKMPFVLGESLFAKLWVSSPSSTTASDGLGPLYNARSCMRCHVRAGRGHPPEPGIAQPTRSSVVHLSIAPHTDAQRRAMALGLMGFVPEPTYGRQLQDHSVQGLPAEGWVKLSYTDWPVTLDDGEVVTLRKPEYTLTELNYGELHKDLQSSFRVTPPMIGLGLIEAIPEASIKANADPDDQNQDGISGRTNKVWNIATRHTAMGRFGWKAGQPTLDQQNRNALITDIGLSNTLFPTGFGECTDAQSVCQSLPDGNSEHLDGVEVSDQMVDMINAYTQFLGVPNRRYSPEADAGESLFYNVGCAACHTPSFRTAKDAPKGLADQLIWPYSDFLLHDMGEGLADHRQEYQADGQEWRTPPLWGVGLAQKVNPKAGFLHDGRARTLEEAILWHGGEAESAKAAYAGLSLVDRTHLIRFLESL